MWLLLGLVLGAAFGSVCTARTFAVRDTEEVVRCGNCAMQAECPIHVQCIADNRGYCSLGLRKE